MMRGVSLPDGLRHIPIGHALLEHCSDYDDQYLCVEDMWRVSGEEHVKKNMRSEIKKILKTCSSHIRRGHVQYERNMSEKTKAETELKSSAQQVCREPGCTR